jgi:hypothetical protein
MIMNRIEAEEYAALLRANPNEFATWRALMAARARGGAGLEHAAGAEAEAGENEDWSDFRVYLQFRRNRPYA